MKKVIVGILIGLALSAVPLRAEWSMGDWGTLKEMRTALVDLAAAHQRLAMAETRSAAALERLATVAERAYPPRAEMPPR